MRPQQTLATFNFRSLPHVANTQHHHRQQQQQQPADLPATTSAHHHPYSDVTGASTSVQV